MKIVVCTTPIRPYPTDYPPFGSIAIMQSLRKEGWDPYFYDIDGLRPSFEQVKQFFDNYQPDVVGISAVVSTAYAYTKNLTKMLRQVCPNARVVVGGNLAASAEILHRLAGVDYCVIGEGEIIIANLMRYLESHPGNRKDESTLSQIRGITYLRQDGDMAFTGYEAALPPDQVFEQDYVMLEQFSRIENFVQSPLVASRPDFLRDPRSKEPHRRGKKMATLTSAKGCVARCTFCHRWDKGYRAIPVQSIIRRLHFLKERYDVGFIQFSDENFGSDKRQVKEFIDAIKKEDILYVLGGVRVRSMTLEILRQLKDSGCVAIYYGMETGSPDILEVMEKKATPQDNDNVLRWTAQAGLYTTIQLVLGMPGETEKTIRETTDFLKRSTEYLDETPMNRMSINYIQALPGTPVYEYARHKGLVGKSLLDEERYLLDISDIDAVDETKFINFTNYSYLTTQAWRRRMVLEVVHHYCKKNHVRPPGLWNIFYELALRRFWPNRFPEIESKLSDSRNTYTKGGYFNLQSGIFYYIVAGYFYPLRGLFVWIWQLNQNCRAAPLRVFLSHLWEHSVVKFRGDSFCVDYKSLRKIMQECAPKPLTPTEMAMAPLREGR